MRRSDAAPPRNIRPRLREPSLRGGEPQLPAEVVAQPARALYADAGGAALVARLLEEAPARLTPGGRVLAELDPAIVEALVEQAGRTYAGHRVHRDAGGHERVLEAWTVVPTNSEPSA